MSKLKGEIKLGQDISNKNDYWIYDENGFICGSLRVAVEELFDIVKVALGVIFLKYKKKSNAVMRLYQYDEIKIKNRPRNKEM